MDDNDFRREFIPLFTFQCTIELLFFSEAIGKKRKHTGEFSVGIKKKEATFCVAVLGKADVRPRYYHVRPENIVYSENGRFVYSTVVECYSWGEGQRLAEGKMHYHLLPGAPTTSCSL